MPEISVTAVANSSYAPGRFLRPVYPGATLRAERGVIGLKPGSNDESGVVYFPRTGLNQRDAIVSSEQRWVLMPILAETES